MKKNIKKNNEKQTHENNHQTQHIPNTQLQVKNNQTQQSYNISLLNYGTINICLPFIQQDGSVRSINFDMITATEQQGIKRHQITSGNDWRKHHIDEELNKQNHSVENDHENEKSVKSSKSNKSNKSAKSKIEKEKEDEEPEYIHQMTTRSGKNVNKQKDIEDEMKDEEDENEEEKDFLDFEINEIEETNHLTETKEKNPFDAEQQEKDNQLFLERTHRGTVNIIDPHNLVINDITKRTACALDINAVVRRYDNCLLEWIENVNDEMKLNQYIIIYDSTIDGFTAQNFNQSVAGQENVMVLVVSEMGNVFGSFSSVRFPVKFDTDYVITNDPHFFVFALVHPIDPSDNRKSDSEKRKPVKFQMKKKEGETVHFFPNKSKDWVFAAMNCFSIRPEDKSSISDKFLDYYETKHGITEDIFVMCRYPEFIKVQKIIALRWEHSTSN